MIIGRIAMASSMTTARFLIPPIPIIGDLWLIDDRGTGDSAELTRVCDGESAILHIVRRQLLIAGTIA